MGSTKGSTAALPVSLVPSDFVHLHNHTHHSLLDGLTKINALVDKVKEFISGSASPHLNVGDIRNFLLPIPPEKECRVLLILLEQRFDTIERLDSELNSMLIKAKQDKQAILFAAFSGKLH